MGAWALRPPVSKGEDPPPKPPHFVPPRVAKVYEPDGYRAVYPSAPAEGSDETLRLQRSDGNVTVMYQRQGPGIYLPEGYEPDWSDTEGDWPRVIVRGTDKTRFIRMTGGTFRRGDPKPNVDLDFRLKPL